MAQSVNIASGATWKPTTNGAGYVDGDPNNILQNNFGQPNAAQIPPQNAGASGTSSAQNPYNNAGNAQYAQTERAAPPTNVYGYAMPVQSYGKEDSPALQGLKQQLGAQADIQNQQAKLGEQMQISAEQRRLGYIPQLSGFYNSTTSGGVGGPHVSGGADPNADAARAAAYARAKDQTGQSMNAAFETLRNQYAGTGNAGGFQQGAGRMLSKGVDKMGDVTREQLIQDLNRSAQVSDRNYQGDITQRGQDMSAQNSLQSLLPQLLGLISSRAIY